MARRLAVVMLAPVNVVGSTIVVVFSWRPSYCWPARSSSRGDRPAVAPLALAWSRAPDRGARMARGTLPEIVNWLVFAIGAALLGGTGAALLTYRRTGEFPGQGAGGTPPTNQGAGGTPPTNQGAGGTPPTNQGAGDARKARSSVRIAVAKCVVGGLLMLWGLGGLAALR
ncbi:MAG: hypothetical protein ACRDYA_15605 [Egibacteraceae bacterium]